MCLCICCCCLFLILLQRVIPYRSLSGCLVISLEMYTFVVTLTAACCRLLLLLLLPLPSSPVQCRMLHQFLNISQRDARSTLTLEIATPHTPSISAPPYDATPNHTPVSFHLTACLSASLLAPNPPAATLMRHLRTQAYLPTPLPGRVAEEEL